MEFLTSVLISKSMKKMKFYDFIWCHTLLDAPISAKLKVEVSEVTNILLSLKKRILIIFPFFHIALSFECLWCILKCQPDFTQAFLFLCVQTANSVCHLKNNALLSIPAIFCFCHSFRKKIIKTKTSHRFANQSSLFWAGEHDNCFQYLGK